MYLSQKQIEDYKNFGVIIIKDVFSEWIEPYEDGSIVFFIVWA